MAGKIPNRHIIVAALLTTSLPPAYTAKIPENVVDVAIIGAGLSGLSTANTLLSSRNPPSIAIIEARSRVGGKVYNHPLKNGGATEVGAEFVGPTQDRILALISELGLKTFDTYNAGQSVFWRNNTRTVYTPDPLLGGAPPLDVLTLTQIATAQARIDELAAELNVSAPWAHPKAREWDSITFADWITIWGFLPDTTWVLTVMSRALWSAEPRELSFLYVLSYVASGGNETTKGTLGRLTAVQGGGQEKRVVGGTGLIPERLADKVGREKIIFNAPVSCVRKEKDGTYTIDSSRSGIVVRAKKVVLALAPPLVNNIAFTPPLPGARQQLNKRTRMGAIGKGIPVYSTPFWRTDGNLSAQVLSDKGATKATFDSSSDTGKYGAILGFILGDDMRALDWKSPAEVQEAIVSDCVRYFGLKARSELQEFILQRWDLEEFSKGGPTAIAPPGVLTEFGHALREKVGKGIWFAGTETSEHWIGYMDGAVRSGERVGREILAAH